MTATERRAAPEYRCLNALKWIRMIAGMHYFGGAFDPEHMRSLANVAANAIDGRDIPDFEESMEKAQERASKWAEELGLSLTDETNDE
jgi:hypothetical protein